MEQVDRIMYSRMLVAFQTVSRGGSSLDWDYTHISNKLYSELHSHLDVDPIKIGEESAHR